MKTKMRRLGVWLLAVLLAADTTASFGVTSVFASELSSEETEQMAVEWGDVSEESTDFSQDSCEYESTDEYATDGEYESDDIETCEATTACETESVMSLAETVEEETQEGMDAVTGYITKFKYVKNNDGPATATITGFEGVASGELHLPDTIGGLTVTRIDRMAFAGCSRLTGELVIPNTVTTIGEYAFQSCGFTGELIIPDSVTNIGRYAFSYCDGFSGELKLPNSVTNIGDDAFYDCSGFTGELNIPGSVTCIGAAVFHGCSGFTGILTIPGSVTDIGNSAFYGCSGFDGVVLNEGIISIGSNAFGNCTNMTDELVIPSTLTKWTNGINFCNFTKITNNAVNVGFHLPSNWYDAAYPSKMVNTLHPGMTVIRGDAYGPYRYSFNYSVNEDGKSVTITGFVTDEEYEDIKIPGRLGGMEVTAIGDGAFKDVTELYGDLDIPESVTMIGKEAFSGCTNIEGIKLFCDSELVIGEKAFYGCKKLDSISTNASVVSVKIGASAFEKCAIDEIIIPNRCIEIGSRAFADCTKAYNIKVPESVVSIASDAFCGCKMLEYIFNNSTASISLDEEEYWYNATTRSRITSICNGMAIKGDENGPFINSQQYTYEINQDGTTITLTGAKSTDHRGRSIVCIPSEIDGYTVTAIGDYAFSTYGNPYNECGMGELIIPDTVETIGKGAFRSCSGITKLKLGNSVKTIGIGAFEEMYDLTGEIVIPDSVTSIEAYAFANCPFVSGLKLGSSVKTIGACAFMGEYGLTGEIVIPDSVTIIDDQAFAWSNITGIRIGNSVQTIGVDAFYNCMGLTGKVIIPNSVKTIGNRAFRMCINLEEIVLSDSLTKIGEGAFASCGKLNEIVIPDSVTKIGAEAFVGCVGLYKVTIGSSVTSLGGNIFSECNNLKYVINRSNTAVDLRNISTDSMFSIGEPYDCWYNVDTKKKITSIKKGTAVKGDKQGFDLDVIGCSISPDQVTIYKGDSVKLNVNVTPTGSGANCDYIVENDSEHPDIVELTDKCKESGYIKVTAQNIGTATITLKADDIETHATINVVKAPTVEPVEYEIELFDGDTSLGKVKGIKGQKLTTLTDAPSKEGYAFDGWFTAKNGAGINVTNATVYTGFDKLYAAYHAVQSGNFYTKEINDQTYTGAAIKPVVRVYDGETLLTLNKDYTVAYARNTNVAAKDAVDKKGNSIAPTVTVTGKGNYTGKDIMKFSIVQKPIESEDITVNEAALLKPTNKKVQKLKPVVKMGSKTLTLNKDYTLEYPNETEGAYKDPGVYPIVIHGMNNFCDGSDGKTVMMTLYDKNVITNMSDVSVKAIPNQKYDEGMRLVPELTVKNKKGKLLVEGIDYSAEYINNSNIGKASVILTGMGNYIGTKTVTFKIVGTGFTSSNVVVSAGLEDVIYNGSQYTPELAVSYKKDKKTNPVALVKDKDYTLTYAANTNVGKGSVTITGMGAYSGAVTKKFNIKAYGITNESVDVRYKDNIKYCKSGSKLSDLTVKMGDITLTEGTDYTLTYVNNKKVADKDAVDKKGKPVAPTVTIKGKKNFAGSIKIPYTIVAGDVADATITVADVTYNKKAGKWKANPAVKDPQGKALTANKDYTLAYTYAEGELEGTEVAKTDAPEIGTVINIKVTAKDGSCYTGSKDCSYRVIDGNKMLSKATFKIKQREYTGKEVTLEDADFTKATIGSKSNLTNLTLGKDFVITGYQNNIKKGTAKVTLKGIGDYGGTKTVTFTIIAKGVKLR